ncbi:MAG: type II secretion system secretin GspD [Desulfobacterales bacterium]|nr:type II secretion system secretin GspD [Desulfobacterales bacterium]
MIYLIIDIRLTKAEEDGKAKDPKSKEMPGRYFSINFNNIDIRFFIKFISEVTGENFVIDERVKGDITVISPAKISAKEAYKVFESVLEVYGYTTVKSGEITKVIPSPDALRKDTETRLKEEGYTPNEKIVTQLVPLQYADANEVKKLFSPFVSKYSVIMSYQPSNMLIITDVYSNIKRLLNMLKAIDVEDFYSEFTVFPIKNAEAKGVAEVLESFFSGAKQNNQPGIKAKFVADKRTNSIFVASKGNDIVRIKKMIDLIDQSDPISKNKIKKYSLENATAEKLVGILVGLKGGKEDSLISEKVKILADKETNSLVIMAEKDEHLLLESIIKELDEPRMMVYIECLIMEVNINKNFKLGTEWQGADKTSIRGYDSIAGGGFISGENLSSENNIDQLKKGIIPRGFSLGVFGESLKIGEVVFPNIAAIIHAFQKDKDVNILSTPQLLTMDNEEASIKVGKNIPYQTKSGSTVGGESYNTYEYKDVGLKLKITPNINKNNQIRLKISEEIEKVDDISIADIKPTTLKRNIDTTIVINNKNTIVIGGLIDDSFSKTNYNVPCLGDIPGLGWLFRSMSKSREKTNLFVFLTPQIIRNQYEGEKISNSKKDQIKKLKKDKELSRKEIPQNEKMASQNTDSNNIENEKTTSNKMDIKRDEFRNDISLNIISCKKIECADDMFNTLIKKGYPAYQTFANIPGKGDFYRVGIYYYKDEEKALNILNSLKKEKFEWYIEQLNNKKNIKK